MKPTIWHRLGSAFGAAVAVGLLVVAAPYLAPIIDADAQEYLIAGLVGTIIVEAWRHP